MINIEKVKTIVSYLADNVDKLYMTKLFKLFYYIDFISYAERGASVTHDTYYKLPYGPVPSMIKNEIDNLLIERKGENVKSQLEGHIKAKKVGMSNGFGYSISNLGEYDLSVLSEYEQELLRKVVNKFKDYTAADLTKKTHEEMPYKLTSDNSPIDYRLAAKLDVRQIIGN